MYFIWNSKANLWRPPTQKCDLKLYVEFYKVRDVLNNVSDLT